MKLLTVHEVRYLLIGGYAVNAHGYVRNTLDIDVWIAADSENQRRVIQAVRDFGFRDTADDVLDDRSAMLRMGVPPLRIEVIKSISGVEFEECWPRRIQFEDSDLTVSMISLDDLKTNKRAAGRRQDLVDVDELS